MKKSYIALAVLSLAALVSCQEEEHFNGDSLGKGDFGFVIGGSGVNTKAASSTDLVQSPVQSFDLGSGLFLTETVEDLNSYRPETKGTPIYTQNLTSVDGYKTLGVVAYLKDGEEHLSDVSFESLDKQMEVESRTGWIYKHVYPQAIWPDKTTDLYFFLRMPTAYLSSNAENFEYDSADGSIEFDYTSPAKGSEQKDILFTSRTLNQQQYEPYQTTGAPVTMYHALTGVKFRSGSDNDGTTKTVIKKVEFLGLNDNGHCIVDPSAGTVTWTGSVSDEGTAFSQTFDVPTYDKTLEDLTENLDGTIDFTNSEYFNGTSWSSKYADMNLNDETGSLTFWLIPQAFTADTPVTLKVTFLVQTPDTPKGTEITHTISDFGGKLAEAGVVWKAGQLRTYTIDPKDIDVDIFDDLKQVDGAIEKSNLHVTNTGNVYEYVRMQVMGNWYGWESEADSTANPNNPRIIVGYKYQGTESFDELDEEDRSNPNWKSIMADYWVRDHELYGTGFDSTFYMGEVAEGNEWVRGNGGYYFPKLIGPGQKVQEGDDSEVILAGTTPLFKSYTFQDDWLPTLWIPNPNNHAERVPAVGVHLVMEVIVQAIGAEKPDGTPYNDCWEAWSAATGKTIGPK